MKYNKLFFTIFISCFISVFMITVSKAQVINENVTLTSQAQVNAFAGTSITGSLAISGSDINDLLPLSSLTSVGGDLYIESNPALTSLSGLDALTSVGGSLLIANNLLLTSLAGLDALTNFGGNLSIILNFRLESISGLGGVNSSVGTLYIENNQLLTSLTGLDNITSVDGNLEIVANNSLTSLTGLGNITSVSGYLRINSNRSLTEFCSLFPLLNGNGLIGAYQVPSLTREQIIDAGACGTFIGDVTLTTQADVISFGANNYSTITGFLAISGSDINDLSPLSSLTSVGGDLLIQNNAALTSLTGLDNITSVGGLILYNIPLLTNLDALSKITSSISGQLFISHNTSLTNLAGLNNISSVGEFLSVEVNDLLQNLDGLSNITSVGGLLSISANAAIKNLDGLSNITSIGEYGGITLALFNNPMLGSFCGLYPVLSSGTVGNGSKNISGNLINPTIQQIIDGGPCVSLTPEEMIAELITSVDGSGIHKGTKRLLTGFLNSADKSLDRGREKLAILKLVAFKWLVKVQSPRKIDAALADEWIGKAEEIIDAIKTALPKSGELDELASEDVLPETYNLNQNYPNPFNPTTTISYSIPENEYVTLSIYDALGKEVAVLDNGFRTAGNYSHTFDASNLSSGMYFYTIRSGNFVQTKKMLLMK